MLKERKIYPEYCLFLFYFSQVEYCLLLCYFGITILLYYHVLCSLNWQFYFVFLYAKKCTLKLKPNSTFTKVYRYYKKLMTDSHTADTTCNRKTPTIINRGAQSFQVLL